MPIKVVRPSGVLKRQTIDEGQLAPFTCVLASVDAKVEVAWAPYRKVTVEGDQMVLEALCGDVVSGTLILGSKEGTVVVDEGDGLDTTFKVEGPNIGAIYCEGGTVLTVDLSMNQVSTFKLVNRGVGSLSAKLCACDEILVISSSSGKIRVENSGKLDHIIIKTTGSGPVEAHHAAAKDVRVEAGGSGELTLWATNDAVGTVDGRDILIKGRPTPKFLLLSGTVNPLS